MSVYLRGFSQRGLGHHINQHEENELQDQIPDQPEKRSYNPPHVSLSIILHGANLHAKFRIHCVWGSVFVCIHTESAGQPPSVQISAPRWRLMKCTCAWPTTRNCGIKEHLPKMAAFVKLIHFADLQSKIKKRGTYL